MKNLTLEKIASYCKDSGYIYPGSDIYGGFANTYDYGHLGAELLQNVRNTWRKKFIWSRENSYEIECSILMNPTVWEASGHVASFADLKIDCKKCKKRLRADNFIEEHAKGSVTPDLMTKEEMSKYISDNKLKCPNCGASDFTEPQAFNLMFETYRGVVEGKKEIVYLRPETAQGQYVNFKAVQRSTRSKLPFAISQIGKSFRNEVTPGNFTFRTIEFEQMEYQLFVKPGTDKKAYEEYKLVAKDFFNTLGLPDDKLTFHDHDKLAHYALAACDVYYDFPSMGPQEINGTHNRSDYDLKQHEKYSGKDMTYLDPETNEKYIPYIIESCYGLTRTALAVLCQAYDEEELDGGDTRIVLRLKPFLAPFKAAIFPLNKKLHGEKSKEIFAMLSQFARVEYDETASIGKRYRRQDAIGTPYCITVDDETLNSGTVTVRERDSMKQEVLKLEDLEMFLYNACKVK